MPTIKSTSKNYAGGRLSNPLLVIVGETASGKTALAIKIAKLFNGEIICADSSTVYRGADIGTAKPTKEQRRLIKHHLVDVVGPDQLFSVVEFKRLATRAIADISKKGKLAILVGGSGLYVDSLIYDFRFGKAADLKQRQTLQQLSDKQLLERASSIKGFRKIEPRNRRYLIRLIENNGIVSDTRRLRPNTLVIGLKRSRAETAIRIALRADEMFDEGVIEEIKNLISRYGEEKTSKIGVIYKLYCSTPVQQRSESIDLKKRFIDKDIQLTKKQRTWFKRNPEINWFSDEKEALKFVSEQIFNLQQH